MNRNDAFPPIMGKEAKVLFMDADFRVIQPGDFVRCAVTGQPIPLKDLRYWSVELQEAYIGPEAAMRRHLERLKKDD